MEKHKKGIVACFLLVAFLLPLLIHSLHSFNHKQHVCCENQCGLVIFQPKPGLSVLSATSGTKEKCPICNYNFTHSQVSNAQVLIDSALDFSRKITSSFHFIILTSNNKQFVSLRGPPSLI